MAALVDVLTVGIALHYFHLKLAEPLPEGGIGFRGWEAVFVFALAAFYWIGPEWALTATLGKYLMGLRVLSINGEDCSFLQSLKRNILRFLIDSQLFYLVGFAIAMTNPRRQRLGDKWAKTIVVTAATAPQMRNQSSGV